VKKQTLIIASAVFLASILFGVTIAAPFIFLVLIPSFGTVALPIDVSVDPVNIDWGTITIGNSTLRNPTLTNNGKDIAALNMTYGNTTGVLVGANYTLTWDAEGDPLPNGYYIIANFILTVYNATEGAFTVDIWINDKG